MSSGALCEEPQETAKNTVSAQKAREPRCGRPSNHRALRDAAPAGAGAIVSRPPDGGSGLSRGPSLNISTRQWGRGGAGGPRQVRTISATTAEAS